MLALRNQHRVIALIGPCAYVIAAFGFLPAPSMVRNLLGIHGAERFPCESHACGCIDADSCRTDCCCYSPSEIRAWAKSNNLDPVGWAVLAPKASDDPEPATEDPMPDDCPLCALGESDAPTEEAPATAGIELPQVSPLGCKQIGQWLLLTPPITTRPVPADQRMTTPAVRTAHRIAPWRFPAPRSLEIPDPPPRST